jgi:4-hydroxybenzoate polyprenyltransferase
MKVIIAIYRMFNLLSIDIAVGAVICSLFFAKLYGVDPSLPSLILLGLSVWIIYTTDRLLDVYDAKGEVTSERHRFHKVNKKVLILCLSTIITIVVVLIFFVHNSIVIYGMFLSVVVIIYMVCRRRLYIIKEFAIALLYTIGVMVPVLPEFVISFNSCIPLVIFFFIALSNLVLFSMYEREDDLKDGQVSIATIMKPESIEKVIVRLFIISFTLTVYLMVWLEMYMVAMVFIIMVGILSLIHWQRNWFSRYNRYRWIGDAIFLIPAFYLLM